MSDASSSWWTGQLDALNKQAPIATPKTTKPILKRILALEHKAPKLEDRIDSLDDRTASLAKAQSKAEPKAPKPAPRAPRGPSMERVREAARAEAMDLYEDRIRLLEAELDAKSELIAKMEQAMRRRGWL